MNSELQTIAAFLAGGAVAASDVPWHALRDEDIRVIREWLGETRSLVEQRRALASLHSVLRLEVAGEEASESGRPRLSCFRPRKVPVMRVLGRKQLEALLDAGQIDPDLGDRDRAITALLVLAGVRRHEIVALRVGDYEDESGCLTVRKASCSRVIALQDECREALEAWLDVRGQSPGPLFVNSRHSQQQELTPSAVNAILRHRCRQSGLPHLSPSDLRAVFLRRVRSMTEGRQLICRYCQTEEGKAAWAYASLALT